MDALNLLMQDHKNVKELFAQIKGQKDDEQRKKIFDKINSELTVHAHIEETLFYPEVQRFDQLKEMVEEALQEHHDVKELLKEMEELDLSGEEGDSALNDLIVNVEHHVGEEEGEMFPKVRELCDKSALEKLGQQLESAKGQRHRQAS